MLASVQAASDDWNTRGIGPSSHVVKMDRKHWDMINSGKHGGKTKYNGCEVTNHKSCHEMNSNCVCGRDIIIGADTIC